LQSNYRCHHDKNLTRDIMTTSLAASNESMERQPLLAHAEDQLNQSHNIKTHGHGESSILLTGKVLAVIVNFWVTGLVSSAIGV
jgi:hypothetical protein